MSLTAAMRSYSSSTVGRVAVTAASAVATQSAAAASASASASRTSLRSATAARVCAPFRSHNSAAPSSSVASAAASAWSSSADPAEVAKFARMSSAWWDPAGEVAPLQRMNPCRVGYVREQVARHFGRDAKSGQVLKGLSVLDVGCGGGLLSESLARLGGRVHGLDAAAASVRVAELHALRDPSLADSGLRYSNVSAETLLEDPSHRYDVVLSLEVVEHVRSPADFVSTLARLVKPGGMLIMSTMNQTNKSWAMAIVAAEHVLRWVPIGTHDWHKFLSPRTLSQLIEAAPLGSSDPADLALHAAAALDAHRTRPSTPLLPKLREGEEGAGETSEATAAAAAQQQAAADADAAAAAAAASRSAHGMRVVDVCGMVYDPLRGSWSLQANDTDCNYILAAVRPREGEQHSNANAAGTH